MPVTWGAIGTGASGTTSCAPSYPTGISAATSKLYCLVTGRSNTANTAPTMPAGWTSLGFLEGGTGTWGVDTGTRRVQVFKKDVVLGTETGTVTVSLTGTTANTLSASIVRVEVNSGNAISEQFLSGADTTNATSYSATASANGTFTTNDLLLLLVAQNIDTGTQSAQSITASGITFGTRTNRASTAVNNGNDHRHIIDSVPVTTGSGTPAAPTYSYTISASGSGPTGFLILTEVVVPQQPPADEWNHWLDEEITQVVPLGYQQHVPPPLSSNEDIHLEEDSDNLDESAFNTAPVVTDVVAAEDMPPAEVVFYEDDLDDVVDREVGSVTEPDELAFQEAAPYEDDLDELLLDSPVVGPDLVLDMPPVEVWQDDDTEDDHPLDSQPVVVDVVSEDMPPAEVVFYEDDTDQLAVPHGSQQQDAVLLGQIADSVVDADDLEGEFVLDSQPVVADVVSEDMPPVEVVFYEDDLDELLLDSPVVGPDLVLDMPPVEVWQDDDTEDDHPLDSQPVVVDVVSADPPPQADWQDDDASGLVEFIVLDFAQVEEDPVPPASEPDFQEEAFDDWSPDTVAVPGAVVETMPPAEVVVYEDDLDEAPVEWAGTVADSPLALQHEHAEDSDTDDEFDAASAIVGPNLLVETFSPQLLPESEDADEEWVQTDTAPVVADEIYQPPPAEVVVYEDDLEEELFESGPVVADVVADMPPQMAWQDDDEYGLAEFIVLDFAQVAEDPRAFDDFPYPVEDYADELLLDSTVVGPDLVLGMPPAEVVVYEDDLEDYDAPEYSQAVELGLAPSEVVLDEDVDDHLILDEVLGEDLYRSPELTVQHDVQFDDDVEGDDDNWWSDLAGARGIQGLYTLDPRWRISYAGGQWVDGWKAEASEVDYKVAAARLYIGSLIMRQRFRDAKLAEAKEVLWFDFSLRLDSDEVLTGVQSITVTVSFGTDATPTSIFNGAPYLTSDAKGVLVPVQAGVMGVDYDIKVVATTNNPEKAPGMVGVLAVRL